MRTLLVLTLVPSIALAQGASSSDYLGRLPDGEEKRRFIIDCTGCHQFDSVVVGNRTRDQWADAVTRMNGYAGATTGFPVISAYREPNRTADWLAAALAAPRPARPAPAVRPGRAEITEFPMSSANDLLHDVAIDSGGRIIVTGMFSGRMLVLDPSSGAVTTVPAPAQNAGARAVELDSAGNWWVLFGGPRQVAKYDPRAGTWSTWDIGMYPHSVALARDGAWFNGHFTVAPEQIGVVRPEGGSSSHVTTFNVPEHPTLGAPGGPIPYELRTGPDGRIWMSELQGNRIIGYAPGTGRFDVFTLPTSWSGPRRFDVDRQGILWIPAYSANLLVRLDPATGQFTEYPIPIADAVPYVARVDQRSGLVWIGTAAADVALSFDPASRQFTSYPLPTRGALVRHIAIDPRNGDVWLAYGASPGRISARIARLRPQ